MIRSPVLENKTAVWSKDKAACEGSCEVRILPQESRVETMTD